MMTNSRCRWSMAAVLLAGILLIWAEPAMHAQPVFTVVHHFTCDDGCWPSTNLLQGWDGTLYGFTQWSSAGPGPDKAFGVTPDGQYFWNGDVPGSGPDALYSGFVEGWNGRLYGVSEEYGAEGRGFIFSVEPDLQTSYLPVHDFSGPDGAFPTGALLQADDGNFYGVTLNGGTAPCPYEGGCGTVFRMTPDGLLTTLHAFDGADGEFPEGPLIQASDGLLYGTTSAGGVGSAAFGTVFRMTLDGTLTTLHTFSWMDAYGFEPWMALRQASDGNLYGVTAGGNPSQHGTVYRLSLQGTLTTIHVFDCDGGRGALLEGPDGNLYGVEQTDICGSKGKIYRVTPAGAFTILWAFNDGDANGIAPNWMAPLVLGFDGGLYGTTVGSGVGGPGVVFRLTVPWN